MRRTARWCAVAATLALAVTPAATASAANAPSPTKADANANAKEFAKDRNIPRPAPERVTEGKLKLRTMSAAAQRQGAAKKPPKGYPQVGDVRYWLALDDTKGYYLKKFKLLGDGQHIQIWVAVNDDGSQALTFPSGSTGECRNTVFGGAEVSITQDQVDSFINEFDNNMFPKESDAFSDLVSRDGSSSTFTAYRDETGATVDLGKGYFEGPGDKVVTLVDNVRDDNYYDPSTPDGQTYIAGFFSPTYASVLNRNIMTIDSFDWLHRTGANPPNDQPVAECAYAGVTARPHQYEGTFAHEYQHLLENDQDADEASWVNEGLSDWAQTLVGYIDPNKLPTDPSADRHISCFQGYLGDNFGGPENSLTLWGDQGGPEILCDYGAAYSFMEYLHGRFGGDAFMSALHTTPGNGLEGLQDVLDASGYSDVSAQDVVHEWLATMALDYKLDTGSSLTGGDKGLYQAPTLKSVVNFDSPQAYESAGAPVNGADFVRLRGKNGSVNASQLKSLEFRGAGGYDPDPVEWTVDGGRLYSGQGDELDRGITRSVTVPAADPTLSADLTWGTELGWDFAYVQVFDPQEKQWVSLPDKEGNTTSEHDPAAAANVVANLPGFSGPSANPDGDPATATDQVTNRESFDLSAYAGQTVDIAFRYITDAATVGDGFWVDNVAVGGQPVSDGTDLTSWTSLTQAHPVPVAGWTVQLVAYGDDGAPAYLGRLAPAFDEASGEWVASPDKATLGSLVGTDRATTTVAALVTADDPTETATSYPTYRLTANGVTQDGGS